MAGQAASAASSAYRERNATADRALDILLMFDDQRLVLSAVEVAAQLSVGRSTAYRYLQSLTQTGFVEEADGSGYRLGPRVLELARLARRGLGLSDIARPIMRRLAADAGETVLLTRLAGDRVVCLEREDSGARAVRITYERGEVLPVNAGASAFCLLAWLPDTTVDALLDTTPLDPLTSRTLTTKHGLRARLRETREQGYAVSRGELDPDVLGIAAAIRNRDGGVVAALSIAALSTRIPDERIPELATALRTGATEIGTSLHL
ncbi:IclR family transcriptional regulator [Nocardia terpenica]|uniref:Glycerol operon regulatory protein n=1 Tax=Nocardia terpenica TaxID=455432 RepID=A0A291RLQ5_9NOCA|nr:IclR family transcriptional regulator [Nocardia terpenica]ATL68245.1 IclR family transcriptional regulator [Nocardia terpenica]